MQNQITVVINDNNIDKTFVIKKAKGMAAFDLFMDINRVIEKADGVYAGVAQQFMHNCMQTGMEISKTANAEVENVFKQHSNELIYFIFNSFFKELDISSRVNILEQIFKHVIFKNGNLDVPLTTDKTNNNVEYVDNCISDVQTIFKICREFVRLNFGHFLQQKAVADSIADSAVE